MSNFVFSPLRVVAGTAVGVGVGQSVADAISPITRQLANEAWSRYLSMPVSAVEAASVVASGERSFAWGAGEAAANGVDEERFTALVDMLDTAPDLSTLYDLLHRGIISEDDFREGARKGYIEEKWIEALIAARQRVLSPAESANAWQQGFMSTDEASAEAERSGVSPARSAIQRELAGLPPGAMDSLQLLRRNIVDEATFRQIVREGHTKTKYTDAILALRDRILTQTDAANLWLRGWISEGEAKAIGAQNGYDAEAMELLYKNRGRPATVRQAHIGFVRGGRLPEAGSNEELTIRRSVEQSNIRSEWFDILWNQRFTYPSAFVVRSLASTGVFDRDTTERVLLESGWKPEYAALAADAFTEQTTGGSTKWLDRARSRLFTKTHDEYMDASITEAQARTLLAQLGATPPEVGPIIGLWNAERNIERRELTTPQILKLYQRSVWTRDEALERLIGLDLTPQDASDLLDGVRPPA